MQFDPDVLALFKAAREANLPTLDQLTPEQARFAYIAQSEAVGGPVVAMAEVRDLQANERAGAIPLRLYRPQGVAKRGAPLLVYFHGGGWVIGDLASHDRVCRAIAERAACVVVAVDYRLAPEHPAPAAAEDSLDAFRWIAAHAADLGADPDRLAVGGDSAGGNLSAVVALAARDDGVKLRAQILIYPSIDLREDAPAYPSRTINADVPPLNTALLHYFRSHYIRDKAVADDWRLSPILAGSKAEVAPALVITAERDMLRDEGIVYADALRGAGVPVEHIDVPGMIHGFITVGGALGAANRTIAAIGAELRQRFA